MSPDFTLTTAALSVFVLCAGFAVLRGVTRVILGTLVLMVSAFAAFQIWQLVPLLSANWEHRPQAWLTLGLPVVGFFGAFFILSYVVKWLARPFGGSSGEKKPRTAFGTLLCLGLAVVPASMVSVIGVVLVHHLGSVDEVRASSEKSSSLTFPQQLKATVTKAIPAAWLRKIDPLADPTRVALAKLIATQGKSSLPPMIDPETGKPVPRAIIVDDPELQSLARDGHFSTLLRHPLLTKALTDPKIQKLLHDFKH